MSTWTEFEITFVQEYLRKKEGPITSEDHIKIRETLNHRSLPAIKKKCLELKHKKNPLVKKTTTKWTAAEEKNLLKEFLKRKETQVTKRIKAIANQFPERSEKALATKLRENHPDIYYMRKTSVETDSEEEIHNHTEIPINNQNNDEDNNINVTNTTIDENNTTEFEIQPILSEEQTENTLNEINEGNISEINELREKFRKIFNSIGKNKKKIHKFYIKQHQQGKVNFINTILKENIHTIENTEISSLNKRKNIKKAIYVAGLLLQSYITGRKIKKNPNYVETQNKIKSLERRVDNATAIHISHRLMIEYKY